MMILTKCFATCSIDQISSNRSDFSKTSINTRAYLLFDAKSQVTISLLTEDL